MPPQLLATRKSVRSLLVLLAAVFLVAGNLMSARAASLSDASLTLSDPRPSETSTYTMTANGFSGSAQCIVMQVDTQADGAGGIPSNFDSTGASLDGTSGMITPANWTLDATTNGTLEITYATGETPTNADLIFTGITNGDTAGTNYALFTTYSDSGCTTEVDSIVVAFAYSDGALVTLTIDPSLTFSVNGVSSSTVVNGATTTVTSTGTAIDFANSVTSASNGISAHGLDVTTNASSGYVVYVRHTGDLTNASGDTIDNHSGTNAAPTAFPAAGTEAWGYTTDDGTLTTGTADRFTTGGGDLWAGFTTTNAPIMDNPAATAGTDTNNVAHQIGIATSTEAGDYETTIVYTIVATY